MSSPFSGRAGRNAALFSERLAMDNLNAVIPLYEQGWGQARSALRNAYKGSASWLGKGYKGFRRDIGKGMQVARGDLTTGYGDAIRSISEGYGAAIPEMQKGVGAWEDNLRRANLGYDMYSNALGLGGEAGRASAEAAFKAGPGYQWQVDQATSQAQRAANRVGAGTFGGNARTDVTRLASNLANQEWGNWVNNLSGYQGAAQGATQGYSGALGNLAELYANRGRDIGEMQANQGKDLAGVAQWGYGNLGQGAYNYGSDRASLLSNYGNSMANAATGRMNNLVGAVDKYYNTVQGTVGPAFAAGQQAGANNFGLASGLGSMLFQGIGGLMGMGGGMGGKSLLGSFFGGR